MVFSTPVQLRLRHRLRSGHHFGRHVVARHHHTGPSRRRMPHRRHRLPHRERSGAMVYRHRAVRSPNATAASTTLGVPGCWPREAARCRGGERVSNVLDMPAFGTRFPTGAQHHVGVVAWSETNPKALLQGRGHIEIAHRTARGRSECQASDSGYSKQAAVEDHCEPSLDRSLAWHPVRGPFKKDRPTRLRVSIRVWLP